MNKYPKYILFSPFLHIVFDSNKTYRQWYIIIAQSA